MAAPRAMVSSRSQFRAAAVSPRGSRRATLSSTSKLFLAQYCGVGDEGQGSKRSRLLLVQCCSWRSTAVGHAMRQTEMPHAFVDDLAGSIGQESARATLGAVLVIAGAALAHARLRGSIATCQQHASNKAPQLAATSLQG